MASNRLSCAESCSCILPSPLRWFDLSWFKNLTVAKGTGWYFEKHCNFHLAQPVSSALLAWSCSGRICNADRPTWKRRAVSHQSYLVPDHLWSTAHENMNPVPAWECLEVGPATVNPKMTAFPVDTLGDGPAKLYPDSWLEKAEGWEMSPWIMWYAAIDNEYAWQLLQVCSLNNN